MTYYEAEAFCNWATASSVGIAALHLPTEAQWEKAARWDAATSTPRTYPWGDVWDAMRCNNWGDTLYPGYQTAPVGSYHPFGDSPYGCRDMAGNVWEWCKDWLVYNYYSLTPDGGWIDPQGPSSGSVRVLRSGYWGQCYYAGLYDRCARREYHGNPDVNNYYIGFRVAR